MFVCWSIKKGMLVLKEATRAAIKRCFGVGGRGTSAFDRFICGSRLSGIRPTLGRREHQRRLSELEARAARRRCPSLSLSLVS